MAAVISKQTLYAAGRRALLIKLLARREVQDTNHSSYRFMIQLILPIIATQVDVRRRINLVKSDTTGFDVLPVAIIVLVVLLGLIVWASAQAKKKKEQMSEEREQRRLEREALNRRLAEAPQSSGRQFNLSTDAAPKTSEDLTFESLERLRPQASITILPEDPARLPWHGRIAGATDEAIEIVPDADEASVFPDGALLVAWTDINEGVNLLAINSVVHHGRILLTKKATEQGRCFLRFGRVRKSLRGALIALGREGDDSFVDERSSLEAQVKSLGVGSAKLTVSHDFAKQERLQLRIALDGEGDSVQMRCRVREVHRQQGEDIVEVVVLEATSGTRERIARWMRYQLLEREAQQHSEQGIVDAAPGPAVG